MADKVTVMKKWIDDIRNDENLAGVTEQELAYIIYAAVMYGLEDEKINISGLFGAEFKHLNWAMSNIWGQIDNIQGYNKNQGDINIKYDKEAIKNLRLEGYTAKQICEKLNYPLEKARSITSNKGWIEAGEILRKKTESVQNSDYYEEESVQKIQKIQTESTDSVQKNTDSWKDLSQKSAPIFDF